MSLQLVLYPTLIAAFASANHHDDMEATYHTWSNIEWATFLCLVSVWALIVVSCLAASLYLCDICPCCSRKKHNLSVVDQGCELEVIVVKSPSQEKSLSPPIEPSKKDKDSKLNSSSAPNAIKPKKTVTFHAELPTKAKIQHEELKEKPELNHKLSNVSLDVKTPPVLPENASTPPYACTPEDIKTAKEKSNVEEKSEPIKGHAKMSSAAVSPISDVNSTQPISSTEQGFNATTSVQNSVDRLQLLVKALSTARKTPENTALLNESKTMLEAKQNKLKDLEEAAQKAKSTGK